MSFVDDSSSEEDEPENKRARTSSPAPVEDPAEEKKYVHVHCLYASSISIDATQLRARDALWAEFQASVANPPTRPPEPAKMVKIVKRFRFAGEDVV